MADDVALYVSCHYENKLAYYVRTKSNDTTGQLYLYDGSQTSRQIDTEVNMIIGPLKNQYYSYWDNQLTYDLE